MPRWWERFHGDLQRGGDGNTPEVWEVAPEWWAEFWIAEADYSFLPPDHRWFVGGRPTGAEGKADNGDLIELHPMAYGGVPRWLFSSTVRDYTCTVDDALRTLREAGADVSAVLRCVFSFRFTGRRAPKAAAQREPRRGGAAPPLQWLDAISDGVAERQHAARAFREAAEAVRQGYGSGATFPAWLPAVAAIVAPSPVPGSHGDDQRAVAQPAWDRARGGVAELLDCLADSCELLSPVRPRGGCPKGRHAELNRCARLVSRHLKVRRCSPIGGWTWTLLSPLWPEVLDAGRFASRKHRLDALRSRSRRAGLSDAEADASWRSFAALRRHWATDMPPPEARLADGPPSGAEPDE